MSVYFRTLKYFRDEYEAHVKEKRCPAKVCRALIEYRHALELDPDNEKAQIEIAQIEDIYRSMNRPIPGEG